MSKVWINIWRGVHDGGTAKFYEVVTLANEEACITVRRWGKSTQMSTGAGEIKMEKHTSQFAAESAAGKIIAEKEKGKKDTAGKFSQYVSRAVNLSGLTNGSKYLPSTIKVALEKHYADEDTSGQLYMWLTAGGEPDVSVALDDDGNEIMPAKAKPAEIDRSADPEWGSW